MGTLAQRRTAGAAAILVLLSILQVVLLSAAPARAEDQDNPLYPSVDCGGEWHWVHNQLPDGVTSGELTVVFEEAGVIPQDQIEVVFNGSVLHYTLQLDAGDTLISAYDSVQGGKLLLSHYPNCNQEKRDIWVDVAVGDCDEKGDRPVTATWIGDVRFTIAGQTLENGVPIYLAPDGYSWTAVPGEHYEITEFPPGATKHDDGSVSGTLDVKVCAEVREASVGVTVGPCDTEGYHPVTVTLDGDVTFAIGGETFTASGAVLLEPTDGDYEWTATPDEGVVITTYPDGGEVDPETGVVTGNLRVEACEEEPSSPPPSQPPTRTSEPEPVSVSASVACASDGSATIDVVISLPFGATMDIAGVGVFQTSDKEFGLPDATTYTYTVTPNGGRTLVGPSSGTLTIIDCETVVGGIQVEPTTTTTAPAAPPSEVVADELPFTGFDRSGLVVMALAALAGGALVLTAVGPRGRHINGWLNR